MKFKHKVVARTYDKNGNLIHTQEGFNTITDDADPSTNHNGLVLALDFLFGKDEYYDSTSPLTKMKLDDATPDDTGLTTPLGDYKTITYPDTNIDISDPTAPELITRGTWDASDGAFTSIGGVGLFQTDTLGMFAFKVFSPALVKTAGGTLTIDWSLTAA